MNTERDSELTVQHVESLVSWLDGNEAALGCVPEGVYSSPLDIYKFLLAKLVTIERDTAETCAEIALGGHDLSSFQYTARCHISATIRDQFSLGESTKGECNGKR